MHEHFLAYILRVNTKNENIQLDDIKTKTKDKQLW